MEKLNQWLTLMANVGVLLGIAFLAYEIRQNTDAIQSQTRATIFSGAQEELWKNMEFPDVTKNLGPRNQDLTADEKIRLDAWLTAAMRAREFAWLEYTNGNLDEEEWMADEEVINRRALAISVVMLLLREMSVLDDAFRAMEPIDAPDVGEFDDGG